LSFDNLRTSIILFVECDFDLVDPFSMTRQHQEGKRTIQDDILRIRLMVGRMLAVAVTSLIAADILETSFSSTTSSQSPSQWIMVVMMMIIRTTIAYFFAVENKELEHETQPHHHHHHHHEVVSVKPTVKSRLLHEHQKQEILLPTKEVIVFKKSINDSGDGSESDGTRDDHSSAASTEIMNFHQYSTMDAAASSTSFVALNEKHNNSSNDSTTENNDDDDRNNVDDHCQHLEEEVVTAMETTYHHQDDHDPDHSTNNSYQYHCTDNSDKRTAEEEQEEELGHIISLKTEISSSDKSTILC
jgi:uncharacterized membrane protein